MEITRAVDSGSIADTAQGQRYMMCIKVVSQTFAVAHQIVYVSQLRGSMRTAVTLANTECLGGVRLALNSGRGL